MTLVGSPAGLKAHNFFSSKFIFYFSQTPKAFKGMKISIT